MPYKSTLRPHIGHMRPTYNNELLWLKLLWQSQHCDIYTILEHRLQMGKVLFPILSPALHIKWQPRKNLLRQQFGHMVFTVCLSVQVCVRAGLYHGDEALCNIPNTLSRDTPNLFWNEYLDFEIPVCDIPRMARLCFLIYGVFGEQKAKKKKRRTREVGVWCFGKTFLLFPPLSLSFVLSTLSP